MNPEQKHSFLGPRRVLAASAALAVVAAAASMPAPAYAAPGRPDPADLVRIVERSDPHTRTTGRVTTSHRTVRGAGLDMTIAGRGEAVAVGNQAVYSGTGVDFVSREVEGGFQVVAVIGDAGQNAQRYRLPGRYLELTDAGYVIVRDGDPTAEPVAIIDPAWARDANGAKVSTRFEVKGDTLTQVSDVTANTPLPVVADPRVRAAWYGWSVDFTRAETRKIAQGAKACVAVAGLITVGGGTVAAAVAAHCGALSYFADLAVENGKCVSLKVVATYLVTWWMPKCYR